MKEEMIKVKTERSRQDFPGLKLEEGEWVELDIRRSKIGLMLIWGAEIVGFIVLTLLLVFLGRPNSDVLAMTGMSLATKGAMTVLVLSLYLVLAVTGLVGTVVYNGNRMFITNKRVIQQTMISLFAKSTNVINMKSIEDVSYSRNTIFEYIFRLGTIRMSTVGDETTYTFKFVDTPRDEMERIMHLLHKNREEKE